MSKPRAVDSGRNWFIVEGLLQAWPSLVAGLLGMVVVLGVGFGGSSTIHDAAHDSRHSLNFPCH